MWPFTRKPEKEELKKRSELEKPASPSPKDSDADPKEKKRETGLYERADVESRAKEALRKHQDAMSRSAFLDAVALRKLEEAKEETDEAVAEVQRKHDAISSVLKPRNGKTPQELALEALEEEEEERARA
jgi:hypothetical protein